MQAALIFIYKGLEKLNGTLKEIVSFLIRYRAIPFLIRNIYARNKVSIVQYRIPIPEVLDKHLDYISKCHTFILLEHLVTAINLRNWTNISPRSLIITIDDGHNENYHLLEVFRKYKVVPTIYLCTQFLNTHRKFWWSVV